MKILTRKVFTLRISLDNLDTANCSSIVSKMLKFKMILSIDVTMLFSMFLTLSDLIVLIIESQLSSRSLTYNQSVMKISQSMSIYSALSVILMSMLIIIAKKCHVLILISIKKVMIKMRLKRIIFDAFENFVENLMFNEDLNKNNLKYLQNLFLKEKFSLHFLQS